MNADCVIQDAERTVAELNTSIARLKRERRKLAKLLADLAEAFPARETAVCGTAASAVNDSSPLPESGRCRSLRSPRLCGEKEV